MSKDIVERLLGRVTELESVANSNESQLHHYAYEAMKAQEKIERLRAEREALCGALQSGVKLIEGDAVGADWKRGCQSFVRAARLLLKEDKDD